ncbi:metallophosphoesterase [candidate division KSB1 bacterium]
MRKGLFLSLTVAVCFILIIFLNNETYTGSAFVQDKNSGTLSIIHGPYLLQPTESSMIVMWMTNKNCVSKVEYGTGDNLEYTAVNSQHGLIDANITIHKVRISGLQAGTDYKYRAVSKEIVKFEPYKVTFGETVESDKYRFRTLDRNKNNFSIFVVNDIHEREARFDSLLSGVNWEAVDIVFLNGDIINHFEDERQIFDGFLDKAVDIFAREIPFIYVRGNHETRGLAARSLMDYFPTGSGRYYYSFGHGPIHFIILDSGEDKEDSNVSYCSLADFDRYRDEQAEWLEEEIKSDSFKEAKFRIVLIHMPLYGGNNWHGIQDIRKKFGSILNKGQIDMMISGHTHRFARIPAQEGENTYPIVIGGTDTKIKIDVSENQLNTTVLRLDGSVVDELIIKK